MIIETVTISAESSKAYQKYICSITARDLHEGDIDLLKKHVIAESLKGINELAAGIESNEKVETVVNTTPSYRTGPIENRVEEGPVVGDKKQFDGFWYKYCFSKDRNSHFWALVDPNDANNGAKKYQKA